MISSVVIFTSERLSNYLFPLHFSRNPDETTFTPLFWTKNACHNREEYYNYGLEKLKEANPNYTFIDRQIYLDCVQKELTREEQEELENLHSQQACLLM